MFNEYKIILFYLFFAFIVIVILMAFSILSVYHNLDSDKLSSYECGFQPFEDARLPFEVRFYIIGVLFIIFDLEIIFLFPWVLSFDSLNNAGFYSMLFFIALIAIGIFHEWKNGALEY
jgi:NADH-quinone oxidoreductase subunit A